MATTNKTRAVKKPSAAVAFLKEKGFTIITDAKKLDAEMRELSHSIKAQDARVALYLLSEITHIEEHRNPTRLNMFFTSIGRSGARVDAMHKFIQLFANVIFVDAGKRKEPMRDTNGDLVCEYFYEMKPVRKEEEYTKAIETAMTKPWTEWKAPTKPQDFTLAGQVKRIIETATRKLAEPQEGANIDVDMKLLKDLEALAKKHEIEFTDALAEAAKANKAKAEVEKKAETPALVEG